MKKHTILIIMTVAVGLVALTGCQKSEPGTPGPAEEAGAAADQAAQETREAASTTATEAGDAAHQAIQQTGAAIEKAGADMQD